MEITTNASGVTKKKNIILRIIQPQKSIIIEIISSLLIVLFVYASLSKLLNYSNFKFQLRRSPYIIHFADLVSWALPVGELIISFLLVLRRTRLLGLYGSFFLMLLFTGYIYAMLNYSSYVPCSCGGILSKMSWNQHLIFNILFTLLALAGIILQIRLAKHQSTNASL